MDKKGQIRIRSKLPKELSSNVEVGGKKYLVMTEDARPFVITRVYLGGKVLKTARTDYASMLKAPDVESKVRDLMEGQHQRALKSFKEEKRREIKIPSDYLDDAKGLLARKNHKNALAVLGEGLEHHPGDPFLLSYYGCLDAVVNKHYKAGVEACLKAVKSLKKRLPFGEEFYYPVFYLNLGRAYLAAGKKDEAMKAFSFGLKADVDNADLLWEMKKLGTRRRPAVSFLKRSNPINKYIGKLMHKMEQ